jgi:hypothetical protein
MRAAPERPGVVGDAGAVLIEQRACSVAARRELFPAARAYRFRQQERFRFGDVGCAAGELETAAIGAPLARALTGRASSSR